MRVGGFDIHHPFGFMIPVEASLGREREIGEQGHGRRSLSFLDVGVRSAAGFDAIEELAGVVAIEA